MDGKVQSYLIIRIIYGVYNRIMYRGNSIGKLERQAKAEALRRTEVVKNRPKVVLGLGYGKGDDK